VALEIAGLKPEFASPFTSEAEQELFVAVHPTARRMETTDKMAAAKIAAPRRRFCTSDDSRLASNQSSVRSLLQVNF
jgi:hypothetical protein